RQTAGKRTAAAAPGTSARKELVGRIGADNVRELADVLAQRAPSPATALPASGRAFSFLVPREGALPLRRTGRSTSASRQSHTVGPMAAGSRWGSRPGSRRLP